MQRAKELALSGRIVEADEAARIGLVTEVVPVEALEQRVTEIAEGFLAGAPVAQMFAKQTLNASFQIGLADALSWEGEAQSVALGTEDAAEGLLAFLEKRDPEWKGDRTSANPGWWHRWRSQRRGHLRPPRCPRSTDLAVLR